METWRAIMTQGAYRSDSKASRYGVLDDDSDKLAQPLISRRDSDDMGAYNNYSHYDDPTFRSENHDHVDDDDDENALERGYGERDGLLRKQRYSSSPYDEIPLTKPSPATVLRSIVANVLWPMTAVGAQTAKVFTPRRVPSRDVAAVDLDDRHALHTVTTLRAPATKSRRRVETLDEIHDRALVRIALATLVFSAWLIITVYRHAD